MERVYIFDCDRIIGDEEKLTIIENMEGKAEVIFDNSEGYDRDTDIVISTRCVGNRDVAGMEVIIREDIGVGCDLKDKAKIYSYIAISGLLWSNWCEYKRELGVDFGEYSLRQYRYAKDYYRKAKLLMGEINNE